MAPVNNSDQPAQDAALRPSEDRPHTHDFDTFIVCRLCGQTEAAVRGCHHCDEPQESGRCWWCLKPQILAATPAQDEDPA